jgi:photosystem II stability/assembly factor-like uncharacterized protein
MKCNIKIVIQLAVLTILNTLYSQNVIAMDAVDTKIMDEVKFRMVGPYRGGRVGTVTGVPDDTLTYYMGSAGGGVWKTSNAGATWKNISDDYFNVGTIGAIAVAPSNVNVLYAGTGEAPIRGVTTSHGDGVYKSTDAGKTWTHVGLKKAGQISRIKIAHQDPDTAFVAVQGQIWGDNTERGIYRTTDGGKSWQQVLKVNASTGASDLTMHPTNSLIMYAAMWDHGRKPWFIKSGSEKGGIWKTTDGGDTWKKLTGGLPVVVGKIGIDISASNPERLYAILEAEPEKGGLYRSDDAGENWKLLNPSRLLHTRAWYYNHITADPVDEDTVYVLNAPFLKSIDGGKTFTIMKTPHGDHHDHWINPQNNKNMINGNDGGATVTFDGGKSWSSIMNQPTAQFYRVITDNKFPFRIYGGQQDNTAIAILSETHGKGIGVADYFDAGAGESAHIAFDENNPRLIYGSTINGTLTELDTETNRLRPIKPYPEYVYGQMPKKLKYRTNWNAPVASSPHNPSIIYYGTDKLLMSNDRGVKWTEISDDLTRNDKSKQGKNGGPLTNEQVGAEFYGNIFYIVESRKEAGYIWTGSDDGLVYLTKDHGENWINVTPKGLPETQINAIELSPHDKATAYIAATSYKLNIFKPMIYMTTNYGQSWKRIDKGLPKNTFTRVIREDTERAGLLYAGTEAGLFISYNSGKNWQSLRANMPPVPITDLTMRHDKLVVATEGRGFYILDDVATLRQLDNKFTDAKLTFYTPGKVKMTASAWSWAKDVHEGINPKHGVNIVYRLSKDVKGPLSLDILDSEGKLVRHYSSEESDFDRCVKNNMVPRLAYKQKFPPVETGLNNWVWDMRRGGMTCIDNVKIFSGFLGGYVKPGTYQARIKVAGETVSVPVTLEPDPYSSATKEDYEDLAVKLAQSAALVNDTLKSLQAMRKAASQIEALMSDYPKDKTLVAAGKKALNNIDLWSAKVTQRNIEVYEDEDHWPSMLDVQARHLFDVIDAAGAPIAKGALDRLSDLTELWGILREERDLIMNRDIMAINKLAKASKIKHVSVMND